MIQPPAAECTPKTSLHDCQSLQAESSTQVLAQGFCIGLCHLPTIIAPTAKCLVQIELATLLYVPTHTTLQVSEPVADNIDEGRHETSSDAGRYQDPPYLARVGDLLHIACETAGAAVQDALPLSLFGILEDPVDGGQVVISNASARPLHVPIQGSGLLCVLQLRASIAGLIQVRKNRVRRVAGRWVCADSTA